ncbi:MAG TPA: YceI family protein [Rhizomicrobium sp.]|jgi:polyisoprenoid-binding protein YceI|nr:YceI family protein [Rhizomicrobium sp.]
MKTGLAAMFLALFAAASPAGAAHWSVDHARSRLGFTVQWSNEPFSAVFKHWNADIDFDPTDLAHADVSVMIDLASEASDEPDFDSGLKGAQGFQTTQFPAARFVATHFIRKSANSYEANGTLTIRGISRDVTLPFSLAIAGRTAHMTGTAHVLRSDFGVGQGEWSSSTPVSRDVTVTIDLTATR